MNARSNKRMEPARHWRVALLLAWVSCVLVAGQIGLAQSEEFNLGQLSPKGRIAYSTLAKSCIFRIGRVGFSGETSKEELALYDLLEDAHAVEAFRSLVKTGSYEGGLYGLLGLSIIDREEFNRAVVIYKARKERPEWQESGSFECFRATGATVTTESGCIIFTAQRDEIVSAIQSGRYDRLLKARD